SLNGFSGRVSLNALATNFQLSLSAPSVTLTAGGNANVTLTIPIPINAPTGLFQFEVSGNTTSYSASLIVPVTITAELHSFNVTIFVPRIAYVPGVSVGNTFTLQKLSVTWTSSIPASIFPEPSFLTLLNDTDHIDILVTAVSGTNVTIRQTWVYSNSTPPAVG